MPTRAQLVAAINTFRGRTPANPIDDDELATFLQSWLDYYDQNGVWNPADVQTLLAQNVALQSSLVARSLNLTATIYVDGVNGNDARTGTTNDNNAVTGCVKTLGRVAALHSGKTQSLYIVIAGALDITANVYIDCQNISIRILNAGTLRFKKYTSAGVGDGTYKLECRSSVVSIYIQSGGTLDVEGHSGTTGVGDQFFYRNLQGAIALVALDDGAIYGGEVQTATLRNAGTFTIGNNTTFIVPGKNGTNDYGSVNSIYRRGYGAAPTLGTGAVESTLIGDRQIPRIYHPTGTSDANVTAGEVVQSNTTNQLFAKINNWVRLVGGLRRYHPTSSTDAAVWEGETVVSPTNNDLYFKSNGTIRRITTAAYS